MNYFVICKKCGWKGHRGELVVFALCPKCGEGNFEKRWEMELDRILNAVYKAYGEEHKLICHTNDVSGIKSFSGDVEITFADHESLFKWVKEVEER